MSGTAPAAATTDSRPTRDHPAKFSKPILDHIAAKLQELGLRERSHILDPFAGVGGVHKLSDYGVIYETYGVELEPEWAEQHTDTMVGDALDLPFPNEWFDVVVTSPCYGNRMADTYTDHTDRHTYTAKLGRLPSPGSSAVMQWGAKYRRFHREAWAEVKRVLAPGGYFILNCSNHIRGDQVQRVTEWHIATVLGLDFEILDVDRIATQRMGKGANAHLRVPYETVAVFRKSF